MGIIKNKDIEDESNSRILIVLNMISVTNKYSVIRETNIRRIENGKINRRSNRTKREKFM